jgi:hypothetical protein
LKKSGDVDHRDGGGERALSRADRRRRARHEAGTGSAPAHPAPSAHPAPRAAALPPTPWRVHALALATVAVLAIALYLPSLHGEFVYDDPNAITQSTLIRQLWPPWLFITMSTRPLTDYSYAIDYAISAYQPWTYHLTSILLHAVNALLLYGIAWAAFATPALAARYGSARAWLAWSAAALFAAHPLESESVAYVSSRSEVLVAAFMLLALGSYIVAAQAAKRSRRRRIAGAVLFCSTAAGLGSKEIAAVIPILLLLYDFLFLAGASWARTAPRRRLMAIALLPLLVGGAALLIRAYVSPAPMGAYGATAGVGFERFTRGEYLMSQFGVILHYLRLVVVPTGQTFDYDWPLARTPFAVGVVVPFLILAGLVYLAVRWVHREPLFTFAIGWTLVILAPTSSVLPIADLAVERRMYLPVAGLAMLAAGWLYDAARWLAGSARRRAVWIAGAAAAALIAAAGALTVQRARLWGDPIALHEDGAAKAPGNPRVRLNLGVTYLNLGRQEDAYRTLYEAKQLYDKQESLQAFPRIGAFIQYNLGAVLYTRKEYDKAEPELRRSLELGGQYLALRPMAYLLLSRISSSRGDLKTAIEQLQEALKYQNNPEWRVDLAQLQLRAGDPNGARKTLQQVLFANPTHARAKALLQEVNKGK